MAKMNFEQGFAITGEIIHGHSFSFYAVFSIYLVILSQSFSDHHLRCGGWLNFEFSKWGENILDGPLKLITRSKAEAC